MKLRLMLAGVVAATLSLSSATQAAPHNPLIVWQGGATLTSLSAACAPLKFGVGDLAASVYRPRLDPAEPNSALTMIFGRSALSFFRNTGPDQMTGAGTYKGHWISGRATSTPAGTGTAGNFAFVVSPTPVLVNTPNVTITGSLTNFAGTVGCTAGFRGSYTRRPN